MLKNLLRTYFQLSFVQVSRGNILRSLLMTDMKNISLFATPFKRAPCLIFVSYVSKCNRSFVSGANKNILVQHDEDTGFFFVEVDGHLGFLRYEADDKTIKLMHTEVPKELGGRGIGRSLAKTALEFAKNSGLHLEVKCEFVLNYIKKNEPHYFIYMKEK